MRRRSLLLFLSLVASCSPVHKTPATLQKPPAAEHRLSELSTTFLYLAAQKALREGQAELATRFLTTLVRKDPKAANPRLQLAELLLLRGKADQALGHIDAVLAGKHFDKKRLPVILLLRARALVTLKRRPDALETLATLLKKKPGLFSALLLQVRLLQESGQMAAAHAAIRQAIRSGDRPELRQLQAQLFLHEGRLKEARRELEAMRRLAPDNEAPVLLLHGLAKRMGDKTTAEKVLRTFLDTHPNAIRVGSTLGRFLATQKRVDEAIAVYEGLAVRTHDAPSILTALGLLHYQQKHFDKAATLFRKSLRAQADTAVRFYLAAALEAAGKRKEAARLYEQFDPRDTAYAEAQLRLAGIDFEQKRLKQAAARLLALIRKQPQAAEAYSMLSTVRLAQEKYSLVIRDTEPAMALQQVPARLLFNRAAAFEHLKDYAKAETHLKRVLRIDPNHVEALNFLGYLYAEMGAHLDEAEQLVKRALKQKPGDGYYMDSLAWIYYRRGDYERALAAQKKAVGKIRDDPVMQDHLGDILWQNGMTEAARQAWRRAIKLKHSEASSLRQKIAHGL